MSLIEFFSLLSDYKIFWYVTLSIFGTSFKVIVTKLTSWFISFLWDYGPKKMQHLVIFLCTNGLKDKIFCLNFICLYLNSEISQQFNVFYCSKHFVQIDRPLKSVVINFFCGIAHFDSNDTFDSFQNYTPLN